MPDQDLTSWSKETVQWYPGTTKKTVVKHEKKRYDDLKQTTGENWHPRTRKKGVTEHLTLQTDKLDLLLFLVKLEFYESTAANILPRVSTKYNVSFP